MVPNPEVGGRRGAIGFPFGMETHTAMTEESDTIHQTSPREIVVTNAALEYGNIEAWTNIIASYHQRHPGHRVIIIYDGEPVSSVVSLFKMGEALNPHAFQMSVAAPDALWKDVPKLYRYLVEGGGAGYGKFLQREIHRVLNLF